MRNYWQLQVTKNIGKYIDRYDMYQRMKNRTKVPVEKFIVKKVLEKLQIHLITDFITKLLLVAKRNVIIVVHNMLLELTYFVTTIERTLAEELSCLQITYRSYTSCQKV